MNTDRKNKVPLKKFEIRLLVCILDRLNALLLHDLTWGTLSVVDRNMIKDLEKRLQKRLRKEDQRTSQVPNSNYDINKDFFEGLCVLLASFIRLDGLGDKYSKRLAEQAAETAKALKEMSEEGSAP